MRVRIPNRELKWEIPVDSIPIGFDLLVIVNL